MLIPALLTAGDPVTDDFLRDAASMISGELMLEGLERAFELLLTVRSRTGAV